MRFRRWPRVTAYQDTPRKRAALARSQRLKRETLPLFAELIAEQQPSPDDEMSRRADVWPRSQQADRDRRAREWRRARTQIATYGNNLRRVINDLWRECPYPVDPSHLLTVLHSIDTGRLDPGRPPWQYHKHKALTPRITPNPLSFEDAFHQISQHKAGGRPQTSPAEAFIFLGNLGSGMIFLTARPCPALPNGCHIESSHHWPLDGPASDVTETLDIQVNGPCSESDLRLIERLAQTASNRPVIVRGTHPQATPDTSPNGHKPP